jgi:hypothetical protein
VTLRRMDNVGIVVESLDDAIAFFVVLGLELEGRAMIDGDWLGRVTGLRDQRVEMANVAHARRPRPDRALAVSGAAGRRVDYNDLTGSATSEAPSASWSGWVSKSVDVDLNNVSPLVGDLAGNSDAVEDAAESPSTTARTNRASCGTVDSKAGEGASRFAS